MYCILMYRVINQLVCSLVNLSGLRFWETITLVVLWYTIFKAIMIGLIVAQLLYCLILIISYRYMQHNDDPTFAVFDTFGGWNKPTMKQYSQDSKECVANLNLDYSV